MNHIRCQSRIAPAQNVMHFCEIEMPSVMLTVSFECEVFYHASQYDDDEFIPDTVICQTPVPPVVEGFLKSVALDQFERVPRKEFV